jgi:archaellum component FlaG (FlaF/FlaG flagellin family)
VVFLTMIALLQLDMNVYRFESGYTEVWYQLPVFCLVDSQHFQVTADTFHDSYSYEFYIKNIDGTDSAYFEGRKTIVSCYGNGDELIVDRIPLNLYNGRFQYTLHITAVTGEMHSGGSIEIAPDTTFLACSDVILGHLDHGDFRFRDIPFLPSLAAGFIDQEVLFSYMEIYGLVPDSLYYEAFYKVTDREGAPIIREKRACMKHDYVQIDTHSFQITGLADGEYVYGVSINDPASQSSVTRTANFAVKTVGAIARGEFTREVQYLIDGREYEYFQDLSETQKEVYSGHGTITAGLKKEYTRRTSGSRSVDCRVGIRNGGGYISCWVRRTRLRLLQLLLGRGRSKSGDTMARMIICSVILKMTKIHGSSGC